MGSRCRERKGRSSNTGNNVSRAVARPPERLHSLGHWPVLPSAHLQPTQWVAAQPRSPRPTVLHHGTRRSQPPCFQRETTAHVVFIEQGGSPSHRGWSLETSSGQFCTGGETEARRGSAEPRHGGNPALPGLLLAQTTEPHCPPGFQGFAVVHTGGFKPSSPASYQLCDLWKVP